MVGATKQSHTPCLPACPVSREARYTGPGSSYERVFHGPPFLAKRDTRGLPALSDGVDLCRFLFSQFRAFGHVVTGTDFSFEQRSTKAYA